MSERTCDGCQLSCEISSCLGHHGTSISCWKRQVSVFRLFLLLLSVYELMWKEPTALSCAKGMKFSNKGVSHWVDYAAWVSVLCVHFSTSPLWSSGCQYGFAYSVDMHCQAPLFSYRLFTIFSHWQEKSVLLGYFGMQLKIQLNVSYSVTWFCTFCWFFKDWKFNWLCLTSAWMLLYTC